MKKTLVALLLASTVVSAPSFAQDTTTTQAPAASSTTPSPAAGAAAPAAGAAGSASTDMSTGTMGSGQPVSAFIANDRPDVFQFSELEGQTVYDPQGNSLGQISDVLMSRDGQLAAVLVGVGGFLGIGQKDVAVSVNQLDFDATPPADMAANTGAGGTGTTTGTMGTGATGTTGAAAPSAGTDMDTTASTDATSGGTGANEAPQRIVLNTTREQLENAPAWDDGSTAAGSNAGTSATAPATTGAGAGSSMAPAQ